VAISGILILAGCTPPVPETDEVTSPTSFVPTGGPEPTASAPADESTPVPTSGGSSPDGREFVVPLVTYSGFDSENGVIEITAFVPDVAELDGECSVTLVHGSEEVTVSQPSRPDATSTQCGSLFAQLPAGAEGEWRAIVTYSSSHRVGDSSPVSIEVG
jgi:hypothetical protein